VLPCLQGAAADWFNQRKRENIMRIKMFPLCFVFASSLICSLSTANADTSLDEIANFADRICSNISLDGSGSAVTLNGEAKANLRGLLEKIGDIGIEGAGEYKKAEWRGVLQKDIANILQKNSDCKLKIVELLKDRIISPKQDNSVPHTEDRTGDKKSSSENLSEWSYKRECEFSSRSSVGLVIDREAASNHKVHGQFGCDSKKYKAKSGFVEYSDIRIPKTENLFLELKYSKNSEPSGKISIFLDNDKRNVILPKNQGDWNKFYTESSIDLGSVKEGLHSLTFKTEGQDYGVADLDMFRLYKKDK
jgi:hypothetical protein